MILMIFPLRPGREVAIAEAPPLTISNFAARVFLCLGSKLPSYWKRRKRTKAGQSFLAMTPFQLSESARAAFSFNMGRPRFHSLN